MNEIIKNLKIEEISPSMWKKYRFILAAILIFVTIDIGVLIPNLWLSSHLKQDAIGINLAGRQRMLSQRMVKVLLQLQLLKNTDAAFKSTFKELQITFDMFDNTLNAFYKSGITVDGSGKTVNLPAATSPQAQIALAEAMQIWQPYRQKLQIILQNPDAVSENIQKTVEYANLHNLALLKLMNDLTSELELIANQKAAWIQFIQITGIILVSINFIILVFHVFLKLQRIDRKLIDAYENIALLNEQLQQSNLHMSAELDIAKQLQQMLLPQLSELKNIRALDIAGFMLPATEVGGDYYDILQHDDMIVFSIGDVTGHGLESGVLAIMVQAGVRTLVSDGKKEIIPFLNSLNQMVYQNVQRMHSDKNLTFAVIFYEDGMLHIGGQHENIIVMNNGKINLIDTIDLGFPIGLVEDVSPYVNVLKTQFPPQSVLVLYTDGIVEAENVEKSFYGVERLCQVLENNCYLSAEEIRRAVIQDVLEFIGDFKQFDDITLVIIKRI